MLREIAHKEWQRKSLSQRVCNESKWASLRVDKCLCGSEKSPLQLFNSVYRNKNNAMELKEHEKLPDEEHHHRHRRSGKGR
jgi:hypothetical protein